MFQLVSKMNESFGNPKGDPTNFDINKVRRQASNIFSEASELMVALGADSDAIKSMQIGIERVLASASTWTQPVNLDAARDALCDVNVFSLGTHHFMGINADRDMESVVNGVMTRFVKNDADRNDTVAKHAAKGVTEVYFEGDYPTMIMKSAIDQPDAPKGKFLKSASYKEPVFYPIMQPVESSGGHTD